MKHIFFCRHGLSLQNIAGLYSGQTETSLSDEGRQQARDSGKAAGDFGIDYIIASPYERALETAQIIAREIGYPAERIELNDNLIERHFGSLEGTPWSADHDVESAPGVEPAAELEKRVRAAYNHILTLPGHNILVVSHGSTGRMLRHVVDGSIPFVITEENKHKVRRFGNAEIVQLS